MELKHDAQIGGLVPTNISMLGEGNESCTAKYCKSVIHLPPPSQTKLKPCVQTCPGG